MKNYENIVLTEWPQNSLRVKMPLPQRAKIFLPFSALTGYEAALQKRQKNSELLIQEKPGKIKYDDNEIEWQTFNQTNCNK